VIARKSPGHAGAFSFVYPPDREAVWESSDGVGWRTGTGWHLLSLLPPDTMSHESRRRRSVSGRVLLLLAMMLPVLIPGTAIARTIYGSATGHGYAELFAGQPGRVFTAPAYSERGHSVRNIHVSKEEYGREKIEDPRARFQPYIDGHDVDVWLAYDGVTVGERSFRFDDARTFGEETSATHHPMYADLHVAPRHGDRPALFCIESHPGDEDAGVSEIPLFLLVDPLSARARLYRLPGLFTSCAAVTATPDGQLSFPAVHRVRDENGQPIGARLIDHRIDGERFVETGRLRTVRFVDPPDPFRFVVDSD